jgi:hypothetical protein
MDIPTVIREKARDFSEKELEDYIKKVNTLLQGMKTGDSIVVAKVTKTETRDLFLEIVKYYMRSHEWQDALSFADGYTELRKYDLSFITRKKVYV